MHASVASGATVDVRLEHLVALQDLVARDARPEIDAALERSKASMDHVREIFTEMQSDEVVLLAARTAHAQTVRNWLYVLILGAGLVGLAGGVWAAVLFGTSGGRTHPAPQSGRRPAGPP